VPPGVFRAWLVESLERYNDTVELRSDAIGHADDMDGKDPPSGISDSFHPFTSDSSSIEDIGKAFDDLSNLSTTYAEYFQESPAAKTVGLQTLLISCYQSRKCSVHSTINPKTAVLQTIDNGKFLAAGETYIFYSNKGGSITAHQIFE
jgi:hypothetical protein